ncbi:MAG: hypothetical protein E6I90_07300 [Chloroflexi bacterium]|nr:MAG: hypothetical protein E6I90_07300 [Chloroflexota bacterium]
MLAEELVVLDADSPLWSAARPLLEAALRLEHREDNYSWHGWNKQQINEFLAGLPQRCSLVVGVWETSLAEDDVIEHEALMLGIVCEDKGDILTAFARQGRCVIMGNQTVHHHQKEER